MPSMNRGDIRPSNILRGILATYSGFSTIVPTNLANVTDGNITTSTGEAKKTLGSAGECGLFIFDLGSQKTVLFGARSGVHSSTGTLSINLLIEPELGDMYAAPGASNSVMSATEVLVNALSVLGTGRYLKLRVSGRAAGDFYIKLYEAYAYELKL